MARKGTWQQGKFNVKQGMVFTMPDMEILHPKPDIDAYNHPWIILNIFNDYIETVMGSTLISNIENKHRMDDFKYDDIVDIQNSCPPMDKPEKRIGKVSLDTAIFLPKKELFSHKIKIWNEPTKERNFTTENLQSLCMNKREINIICDEIRIYQKKYKQTWYDPFNCQDSEEYIGSLNMHLPVPEGFTREAYDKQFGWKHLPKADWKAIYPFEDQMYDYEKQDPELVKIAKLKKQAIQKQKRKQQADDKFGHIQANNPDTGLGLGE